MRDMSIETPLIGRKRALWVLAVCGAFSLTAPARADVVTDWNELTFRVSLIGGAPAQNAGRVAAIVQAAVFDALNAIDRRYTPIHERRRSERQHLCYEGTEIAGPVGQQIEELVETSQERGGAESCAQSPPGCRQTFDIHIASYQSESRTAKR